MKKYRIITKYGTTYEIDLDGCFLRSEQHKWDHPHDTWKCTGIAELRPFGRLRFIMLEDFIKMIENSGTVWKFKNGKPKYTLTDRDHGTNRVHGNTAHYGIYYAYEIK